MVILVARLLYYINPSLYRKIMPFGWFYSFFLQLIQFYLQYVSDEFYPSSVKNTLKYHLLRHTDFLRIFYRMFPRKFLSIKNTWDYCTLSRYRIFRLVWFYSTTYMLHPRSHDKRPTFISVPTLSVAQRCRYTMTLSSNYSFFSPILCDLTKYVSFPRLCTLLFAHFEFNTPSSIFPA